MSKARDKRLVGREWVDLLDEDLHYVMRSDDLNLGGNGKVQWVDPSRREMVAIHLFGAIAQADYWIRRISHTPLTGVWKRPSHIVEGDVDYPIFEQLLTPALSQYGFYSVWCDQNAPRVRPHIRELIRTLKEDHDLRVTVLAPEINDHWDAGMRLWLQRKGIPHNELRTYPLGADPSDYLTGCSGYIDNHPERVRRASEKKQIKLVSLLRNAWNALEGAERLSPQQIMQQYG